MTRPALATVDDLERLLCVPSGDEDKALARLEQASAIVRAYARETWLNDDGDELEDVPDDIPGVVTQMVERATRNPSGATAESAGPFARSFGPEAAQKLYLTAADKLVIRAAVGSTGIGTLPTTRGHMETPHVIDWCETYEEVVWPS